MAEIYNMEALDIYIHEISVTGELNANHRTTTTQTGVVKRPQEVTV